MTALADIRKWVRPLVQWRPDLVLEGRVLVLKPIGHIVRGLMFHRSYSRQWPEITWFLYPAFCAPSAWNSVFKAEILLRREDEQAFIQAFTEASRRYIEQFILPHENVQAFYDFTMDDERFAFPNLNHFGPERATMLAALGRFEEAEATLVAPLADIKQLGAAYLAKGEALLSKRRNSAIGKSSIRWGNTYITHASQLDQLLAALATRDPATVAPLLHAWEQRNVTRWGVDHLWRPTPFPFETGLPLPGIPAE